MPQPLLNNCFRSKIETNFSGINRHQLPGWWATVIFVETQDLVEGGSSGEI